MPESSALPADTTGPDWTARLPPERTEEDHCGSARLSALQNMNGDPRRSPNVAYCIEDLHRGAHSLARSLRIYISILPTCHAHNWGLMADVSIRYNTKVPTWPHDCKIEVPCRGEFCLMYQSLGSEAGDQNQFLHCLGTVRRTDSLSCTELTKNK